LDKINAAHNTHCSRAIASRGAAKKEGLGG